MTRRTALGWVLLALAAAGAPAAAQTARLHVLADTVALGEPFPVAVVVERPAGSEALLPAPPLGRKRLTDPLRAGDAELVALRRLPPRHKGTVRVDSALYTAVTFATGRAQVGPLAVPVVRQGDTTHATTAAAAVAVRSTLVPGDDTPAGLLAPPTFPRSAWPWAVAAALLAGAAALLARRVGRRRHPAPPPPPPADEALARLAALETAEGPRAWVELAAAVRTYLARAYAVPARERTTAELLRELPDALPDGARADLRRVLQACDLVKFARAVPPQEAFAEALARARTLVRACEAARAAEADRAGASG